MSKGDRNRDITSGLIIGFLLAALLFVVLGALPITVNVVAQAATDCGANSNDCEQSGKWTFWGLTFVAEDTIAQWVMMIFTTVAAFLLLRTLVATRDMAISTREIGQNQLRPWMVSSGATPYITKNSSIDGEIFNEVQAVHVAWRNSGHSPAVMCSFDIQIKMVPIGADFDDFEFSHEAGSSAVGQGMEGGTAQEHVPTSLFDRFQDCQLDLIVGSRVNYGHSLNEARMSFTEVIYRIRRNGVRIDPASGEYEPNYHQAVVQSRMG